MRPGCLGVVLAPAYSDDTTERGLAAGSRARKGSTQQPCQLWQWYCDAAIVEQQGTGVLEPGDVGAASSRSRRL
jgi:hypothetical protein